MILTEDGLFQFTHLDETHFYFQDEEDPSTVIIFYIPDNYEDSIVVIEPDGELLSKEKYLGRK